MGFNCCYLGYEIGMQFVFKYADWKKCSIKTKVDMIKVKENQPQTCAAGFSNGNRDILAPLPLVFTGTH